MQIALKIILWHKKSLWVPFKGSVPTDETDVLKGITNWENDVHLKLVPAVNYERSECDEDYDYLVFDDSGNKRG